MQMVLIQTSNRDLLLNIANETRLSIWRERSRSKIFHNPKWFLPRL